NNPPRFGYLLDDARLDDVREDEGRASDDVPRADSSGDLLLVVDSVLERDDGGVGAQKRFEKSGGLVRVVGLHAEEDEVTCAELSRIVARGDTNSEILVDTTNLEPVLLERSQVSTAGKERHVHTGER